MLLFRKISKKIEKKVHPNKSQTCPTNIVPKEVKRAKKFPLSGKNGPNQTMDQHIIRAQENDYRFKIKCHLCLALFDAKSDFDKHFRNNHASNHEMTIVKDDPLEMTGPTILDANKHLSTGHEAIVYK